MVLKTQLQICILQDGPLDNYKEKQEPSANDERIGLVHLLHWAILLKSNILYLGIILSMRTLTNFWGLMFPINYIRPNDYYCDQITRAFTVNGQNQFVAIFMLIFVMNLSMF
jgi:hypothetical protein